MRAILSCLVLMTCAMPALAQTVCTEPAAPMPVDGGQATADQMRAAMGSAHEFMAQSQIYQDCLQHSDDPDARLKIAASQRAQETVGKSINAALETYKRAQAN